MATIAENAQKTLDYLERYGWIQNKSVGLNGKACLGRAIELAIARDPCDLSLQEREEVQQLWRHLLHLIDPRQRGTVGDVFDLSVLTNWNDAKERTYEDVVELLTKVVNGEVVNGESS